MKQKYYKRPAQVLGEYFGMKLFPYSRLVRKSGFDVRVLGLSGKDSGSLRVEVKCSEFNPRQNGGGWAFCLNTRSQHIWGDYFLLVCLKKNFEVLTTFLVPRQKLRTLKSLWIGKRTIKKYARYIFP